MADSEQIHYEELEQQVSHLLANRRRVDLQGNGRPSAVLVPLFWQQGTVHLLLNRRTCKVEHHKGEISFPGGARDDSDTSLAHTMLRETQEELGIASEHIRILGTLDDTITLVSNFVITPFVGIIPFPYPFHIETREIQELLYIPLAFFSERRDYWHGSFRYQSQDVPCHFYRWQPDCIVWGATARIIHGLCELVATSRVGV